jgi:hypothetical protein
MSLGFSLSIKENSGAVFYKQARTASFLIVAPSSFMITFINKNYAAEEVSLN